MDRPMEEAHAVGHDVARVGGMVNENERTCAVDGIEGLSAATAIFLAQADELRIQSALPLPVVQPAQHENG